MSEYDRGVIAASKFFATSPCSESITRQYDNAFGDAEISDDRAFSDGWMAETIRVFGEI